MASTYVSLRVHLVFATKGRRPVIADAWRNRLHEYLGGVLRGLGATPLAIGGVSDHVHILVGIKTTHAVADLVREIKKASTEWVRNEAKVRAFQWQEGYAALSVGETKSVIAYVQHQEEHHRRVNSADELRALLEEAGVEVNPRYFE